MNYVVVDLEWNQAMSSKSSVFNKLPIHLRGEIIEIGAVKLDGNMRPTEEFTIDVRPVYFRRMHYKVKKITGFDKDRLAHGVSFPEALEQFRAWCGEDVTFLTWGCDDQGILEQNIIIHDLDWDWIAGWINLQLIYNLQTGGDKNQKSLASAMEHFEIEQTRIAHDALGDAYNTALTALDVTGCPALESISCYGAKIASLDLSKNAKLSTASVGCTTLASLTLPEEPVLASLSIDNAAIDKLDLSKLTKLTSFAAAATKLETIDLSNSPLLTSFSVGSYGTGASNSLKVVDMRKATKLNSVNLYSSVLEEVIVPKGTKTSSWNWTGTHMDPDTGAITTVKVTEVEVEDSDEPAVDDYAAGIAEPFVKKLVLGKFDKDGDGAIDAAEAEAVTELDLSDTGLEDGDLKGLEVFPIEKLILDGNKFTSFDVLAWPKLSWLSINKNKLTELSIGSSYTALNKNLHLEAAGNKIAKFTGPSYYAKVSYLDLHDNQLSGSFSMPYCSTVEYVDLSGNALTSVNLTSASAVKEVNVSHNALTSVAFSGFGKLEKVDVSYNKLSAYSVSASQTALAEINLSNNAFKQLDITSIVKSAALKKIDLTGNPEFTLLIIGSGNTLPETLEVLADTEFSVFAAKNPTKELTYNRYSYISGVELGTDAKEIDLTVNYATSVKAFEVPAGSTLTITCSGARKALRLFALGIGGKPTVTVSRTDDKKVYNHSDNNYCSENPYTCAQNTTYKDNGVVIDGDGDSILYFFGPTTGSSSGGLVDGEQVVLTVGGNAGESVLIVGLNLETYTTDDYGWM